MSLIMQRSIFSTPNRTLTLEANPSIIETLEQLAIALGASPNDEISHRFDFNFDSDKQSEKCLLAVEKVWDNIEFIPNLKIQIRCNPNSIIIEGNDDSLQTLVGLVKCFGKEIVDGTVTFSEDEWSSFHALHNAIISMGILPYC